MTDSQRWLVLCVVFITAALFYLLKPMLFPFLMAMMLAYLWDPMVDRLEAAGLSRTLGVVVVFVVFAALLAVLVLLLVPMLGHQIDSLGQKIPLFLEKFETVILPWVQVTLGLDPNVLDFSQVREALQANWKQGGNMITQVLSQASQSGIALAGWVANMVLIPVVLFYMLRDWDLVIAKIQSLLPLNLEPGISRWACECDEVLGAFVKGQLLVMLVLSVVYSIGLALLGLDLALLVGMIAGLASIVPYMGFIVGILAAAVAAFMQFHDVFHLLLVLAVFGFGQMLEGMVLTPLLVGDKIGLHPVAVIFAIMAGGQLFGFAGVLLALPVAAVIMVLLRHFHEDYKDSELYHASGNEPLNLEKEAAEK